MKRRHKYAIFHLANVLDSIISELEMIPTDTPDLEEAIVALGEAHRQLARLSDGADQ